MNTEIQTFNAKGGSKEGLRAFDLHLGDCLEAMKSIPGGSVDMVLADLP